MNDRQGLDAADIRILSAVQKHGQISKTKLAEIVNLSPTPCWARLTRLRAAGNIRGYHADIDTEALGFGVTVFANVGLHSQAEADLVAFEERVSQWPEVRECHMLAGETDFLLKIVASDWDAYQKFLTTNLTPAPNVSVVKSALGIRTSKRAFGVPIDLDAESD